MAFSKHSTATQAGSIAELRKIAEGCKLGLAPSGATLARTLEIYGRGLQGRSPSERPLVTDEVVDRIPGSD